MINYDISKLWPHEWTYGQYVSQNFYWKTFASKNIKTKSKTVKGSIKNGFYHFFNRLVFYIYTLLSFMIDNWHYNKDYNKIDRGKEWQNKWKI